MAQATVLASFLLGVILVAVAVLLLARGRYRYTPRLANDRGSPLDGVVRAAKTPAVWTITFVFLALLAGSAAVLAVGGFDVSPGVAVGAGVLLAALGAIVLVGYVFYGTFVAARARGLHSAQAAAFGSWAVGLLVLVAVAANLLGFV